MAESALVTKSKVFALEIIRVCNEIKHSKRERKVIGEGELL